MNSNDRSASNGAYDEAVLETDKLVHGEMRHALALEIILELFKNKLIKASHRERANIMLDLLEGENGWLSKESTEKFIKTLETIDVPES